MSTYPLIDAAFNHLCFVMTGLGSPPAEDTLDKVTTQNIKHLTFCAVAFTLWTRYIHHSICGVSDSVLFNFATRNFELVKMKCGDITADDIDTVNSVFLKYLRGEEVSLTINDLHIHFKIYLSNWKGWQRKSDKGERDIHLHSASESVLVVAIVWTSLHSPGNHYKIYLCPDMGRACDPFFWVLFWMNWVKYVHLGQAMGAEDFLFPAVGASGVIQSGWPLSHDLVQKSIDAAVNGAKIPGKFSMHCFCHSGAQYRFMSTPLGERWSLQCVHFWGGWAEGEQVSTCRD